MEEFYILDFKNVGLLYVAFWPYYTVNFIQGHLLLPPPCCYCIRVLQWDRVRMRIIGSNFAFSLDCAG